MTMFKSICAAVLLILGGIAAPTNAAPPAGQATAGVEARTILQDLVSPAASRLCGRTLGGRCTKGRAACSKGDEASCKKWKTWSEACNKCAVAFAKCRSNPRKSCESCITAHDACEANAR